MGNKNLIHAKIEHGRPVEVHSLPKGRRTLHRDYGLWIVRAVKDVRSPSRPRQPRYFEFYSLSHLTGGQGRFWTPGGGVEVIRPGQAVMMPPRLTHYYGAWRDDYVEDAVCFAGRVADDLRRVGVIRDGLVWMGEARRLLPIIRLATDPAEDAQIAANAALQKLLVDLHLERRSAPRGDRYERIRTLVADIQRQPTQWLSVREMARFCNVSEMHLRRLFREHTGMTPKAYLDNVRVQYAVEQLAGQRSIAEIARSLGFSDPFHFSRRFKQLTGLAPRAYRDRYFPRA